MRSVQVRSLRLQIIATSRSRVFWSLLFLVIVLALLHDWFEASSFGVLHPNLEFLPVSILWFPVLFSALRFGFFGAVAMAFMVIAASIPNVILFHDGIDSLWELSEFTIITMVALVTGYMVDQRSIAMKRASLYARSAIRSREQERKQLSQDLHDETVQSLIVVCRQIDKIKTFGADISIQMESELTAMRRSVEHIIENLRKISQRLRPSILDDFGLTVSLNRLVANFKQRTGCNIEFEVRGEEINVPGEFKLGLLRIVQEALNNIERHANANNVKVSIESNTRAIRVEIQDNGKGFVFPEVPQDLSSIEKFGILGIQERAEFLGGQAFFETAPGHGTKVKIIFDISKMRNSLLNDTLR